MIKLNQIFLEYGNFTVLNDVTLHVDRGECIVLIGPSGCGKTTIIKAILGLIQPKRGIIEFEGQRITPDQHTNVRRRIGYVMQQGGLFPHLDVSQNLGLVPSQFGWKRATWTARARELLALVRIEPRMMSRYPSELSGGQRQRIGLARALMLDPPLLLMDEPLGALDPMVRRELQEDLRSIFKELDKAVLLVTHDLHEASYFADRIAMMNEGKIIQQGSMQQLLDDPAEPFVKRFVEAQRAAW